jgi:iron complex outermembrane receptor protein
MAFNNTRGLRGLLTGGVSVLTLAMAGAVYAQEAPAAPAPVAADEVDAVVVTGFRASLASAMNLKRSARAWSTPSRPRTSPSSPT